MQYKDQIVKIAVQVWTIVLLIIPTAYGQEMTGEEIIKKVNEIFNPASSYGRSKMTIVTTSGQKRTFEFESWSKDGGEKNLVRYHKPGRVKDQATLMLNHADDIWMFFPRTQRVRKLATHAKKQKMQGSDFSYEDMGSGDTFITDFTPVRLGDEKMNEKICYKLEMVRKEDSDLSYSRMIMWIIKENFVPVVIDYYDEKDPVRHIKRLVQSNIRLIGSIPTAMRSVMYNRGDNSQTELELLEIKYDLPLSDAMFTERSLKK